MRIVRNSGRISGGVSALGDVCSGGGGFCSQGGLLWGGVSALGVSTLGGVCSRGSVYSWGGLLQGGVCSGGCGIQACTEADTPTPPVGQTDASKNITFATSSRTVKILKVSETEKSLHFFQASQQNANIKFYS